MADLSDIYFDLVATQAPARGLAGGDYRLPLDIAEAYALEAARLNIEYRDDLLVVKIAVIRDPEKRKAIIEGLGGKFNAVHDEFADD